jgi:hypothetical protein
MKSRTVKQNSALHVYAGLLAEALDDAGHDMRPLIQVPIKPTMDNVKETIIKPVMTALYPGITSTTQLTTKQINELYEVVNRATAEKLGISIEFPSVENIINAQRGSHERED